MIDSKEGNIMDYQIENLEQILLKESKITEDQMKKAMSVGTDFGKTIGKKLVTLGFIAEDDLLKTLTSHLKIEFVRLSDYLKENEPYIENRLSGKYLKEYQIFPLKLDNEVLHLLVSDPWNFSVFDELRLILNCELRIGMSCESEILDAVEQYYGSGATVMQKIVDDVSEEEMDMMAQDMEEDADHLKDMASDAPVIKLVNLIISKAVERDVSDIHIEPFEDSLRVRYRIDGLLYDVESPPKKLQSSVISRVKIMAKLNIAEKRLPQDGRIRLKIQGKDIDMRISSLPTLYGESVVMRILDRGSVLLDLKDIGFPPLPLEQFKKIITKPYGMLLVTGPTGSGKTTTLYASLHMINSSERKIITIEDPVEYQLHGINQIHVNAQIGLTFSSGLRSIVRQDPDVIMVGEIRDSETADIAIQSALTGHMVFSTVHTNDSAGAIARLQDMGIESFLISSAVVGVLAQRLVRVICRHCKKPFPEDKELLYEIGGGDDSIIPYRGVGCDECSNTGYKGRRGIYELLTVTDSIRQLILEKTSSNIIKEEARKQGMKTLREDGLQKVKDGITSMPELLRVTLEEG